MASLKIDVDATIKVERLLLQRVETLQKVVGQFNQELSDLSQRSKPQDDLVESLRFCVSLIEGLSPEQRLASGLYSIHGWDKIVKVLENYSE